MGGWRQAIMGGSIEAGDNGWWMEAGNNGCLGSGNNGWVDGGKK